ncbi:spore cortex biosynthesis protein YabQ, partial [Clostridium perfringens]|uniref:spore cortex biosynthesis protein YabQ n=1 Tax=Clostridium perfringens TaxID=1502 RepID=UPI002AC7A621
MPLPIGIQFDIVIYSIVSGILIGVLFDLYNIIRGVKIPKIIIIIEDVLFWILTAIIVFTFLLYINYAFLGPYVYIFMIITLIIYLKL